MPPWNSLNLWILIRRADYKSPLPLKSITTMDLQMLSLQYQVSTNLIISNRPNIEHSC